ncbi:MAG: gamma-glutamyl-gamma-aminobutyrate hydrolase family protein [Phycisphaerales bacterium]|nr:gamma-glutamyl-gamma-aminobutyrate hydrolase family protein [Phycisphaerales bacterium]
MPADRPLIAIAPDIAEPMPGKMRAICPLTYTRAIVRAGGLPVILDPDESLIEDQLGKFDGFVLIGGDDPRTEPFGVPTHPAATPMHELRQRYETALARRLLDSPEVPVLGICLGMQMLGLIGGAAIDQHMPETLGEEAARRHRAGGDGGGSVGGGGDARHAIVPEADAPDWFVEAATEGTSGGLGSGRPGGGGVASHHHQRLLDVGGGGGGGGGFRVAARSPDGVIEAIWLPGRPLCLGVQWHPERTEDAALGAGMFSRLIRAARGRGR